MPGRLDQSLVRELERIAQRQADVGVRGTVYSNAFTIDAYVKGHHELLGASRHRWHTLNRHSTTLELKMTLLELGELPANAAA